MSSEKNKIIWTLTEVTPEQIKVNPNNPKVRNTKGFERLKRSISKFGIVYDGICNKDFSLIDGHSRKEITAGKRKLKVFIPSRQLSEKEYKEMNAFYDISRAGDSDKILIEHIVGEKVMKEWGYGQQQATEDNFIPMHYDSDIKTGDLFEIGIHKLVCGDALDESFWQILQVPRSFCCFTSPPYNMGINAKLVGYRQARKRGSVYHKNSDAELNYSHILTKSLEHALKYCSGVGYNVQPLANNKLDILRWINSFAENFNEIITWKKSQAAPAMARGVCTALYEWIVIFSERGTRAIPLSSWRGTISNIYDGPPQRGNEYSKYHAATFPVHLPSFIMEKLMNRCEGLVDCFGGTGTSMVAANPLNKPCYIIEKDSSYCQMIVDRMLKLDASLKVLRNGKPYQPRK